MAMALALTDVQSTELLDALGLPEDTSDPELVIATAKDLAAQAAGMKAEQPASVAAAAAKHGMDLVDHDTHESLKAAAAEGRRVVAAARLQAIEAKVDDAVSRGKITVGRRKHWITLLQNDDSMADVLAGIADETAIALSEIGHSADTSRDDLAEAGQWFY